MNDHVFPVVAEVVRVRCVGSCHPRWPKNLERDRLRTFASFAGAMTLRMTLATGVSVVFVGEFLC